MAPDELVQDEMEPVAIASGFELLDANSQDEPGEWSYMPDWDVQQY